MTCTEQPSKADQRVALRWIPKDSRKIEHALGGKRLTYKRLIAPVAVQA